MNYSNQYKAKLNPNIDMALHHLSLIDQSERNFTFQTFDDNQDRRNPKLVRLLHGSLEEHFEELVEINNKGGGIFVTVNKTNLKGRSAKNIVGVRAIWQEDDGDGLELPIKPHLVIESSPKKYHRYFFTSTDQIEQFSSVQMRMVNDYGSDPAAKDLPRVLRLAGFYHQKINSKKNRTGIPHMVSITHQSDKPFLDWEELKKIFPPIESINVNGQPSNQSQQKPIGYVDEFGFDDTPSKETLRDLKEALLFLAKAEAI